MRARSSAIFRLAKEMAGLGLSRATGSPLKRSIATTKMMNSSLITKLPGILIIVFSLNVFAHTGNNDKMIDEILNYWFDYHHHSEPLYDRQLWWDKNDKTDHFIKNTFGEIRKQAIKGELDHWFNSTKGTLAYVILIDQFSRNIYRNTPEMFENDELARTIIKQSIKKG